MAWLIFIYKVFSTLQNYNVVFRTSFSDFKFKRNLIYLVAVVTHLTPIYNTASCEQNVLKTAKRDPYIALTHALFITGKAHTWSWYLKLQPKKSKVKR